MTQPLEPFVLIEFTTNSVHNKVLFFFNFFYKSTDAIFYYKYQFPYNLMPSEIIKIGVN